MKYARIQSNYSNFVISSLKDFETLVGISHS